MDLPCSKKQKLDTTATTSVEDIMQKATCVFKDPLHVLKDPIRLPCSKKFICKECMWMTNPSDKTFRCGYCKKNHVKGSLDYEESKAKTAVNDCIETNIGQIASCLTSAIHTHVSEIKARLENREEILKCKDAYWNDELLIPCESVKIKLDMISEELENEFNKKVQSIKQNLAIDPITCSDEEKQSLAAIKEFTEDDDPLDYVKNPRLYLQLVRTQMKQLDDIEHSKYDSRLSGLDFLVSSQAVPSSLVGKFRIGSLDFSSKFKNVKKMNRVDFADKDKYAIGGNSFVIDADSNIISLCSKTDRLVKMNLDASEILLSVDLQSYFKAGNNAVSFTSEDLSEQPETPMETDNDSDSSDDRDTTTHHQKFLNICISEDQRVYILYRDYTCVKRRDKGHLMIMCLNKDAELVYKCSIDKHTIHRNYHHRVKHVGKMFCHTARDEEHDLLRTRIYIPFSYGTLVFDDMCNYIGFIHFEADIFYQNEKIIAKKGFTYILSTPITVAALLSFRIIIYEHNITEFEVEKYDLPDRRGGGRDYEVVDSDMYNCRKIYAFSGDDMGNVIYIARSDELKGVYLFSINTHGQLLYTTKLFDRQVIDIEIDHVTSMNYRMLVGVRTKKELMWIYEFENSNSAQDEEEARTVRLINSFFS